MTKFRIIVAPEDIPYLEQVLEMYDYKIHLITHSIPDNEIVTLISERDLEEDYVIMDAYTIGYFVNKFKTSQCTK
jgi:hypothetical protein